VLSPGASAADIPGKINYQGKLTNAQGQLIDGQYNMVFTLFDAASGGTQKWTETHNSVQVTNGLFNVMLGATNNLTTVFQGNDSLWLQVTIGTETLLPRQEMASVGYALNIADALKVPRGVITMWSGALDAIPSGWVLCDGTQSTPDLRDRFIVGAGGSYAKGATGGEAMHTLTIAEMPSHSHLVKAGQASLGSGGNSRTFFDRTTGNYNGNSDTGGGAAHENRPPYYALAYIRKL